MHNKMQHSITNVQHPLCSTGNHVRVVMNMQRKVRLCSQQPHYNIHCYHTIPSLGVWCGCTILSYQHGYRWSWSLLLQIKFSQWYAPTARYIISLRAFTHRHITLSHWYHCAWLLKKYWTCTVKEYTGVSEYLYIHIYTHTHIYIYIYIYEWFICRHSLISVPERPRPFRPDSRLAPSQWETPSLIGRVES